jgi:hypothetical protein
MKLKEILGNISQNRKNGQLTTCIRKNKLKKAGISENELFNMKVDIKLKKLLYED